MNLKLSNLGERRLIRRIARLIRSDSTVIRGIGDDCAVLKGAKGWYRLFASDMLVEDVHFRSSDPAAAIGWKALAVNVSDVAAMGGIPRYAVISLGLPKKTPVSFVDRLYQGLRRCADRFGVNLVGGDTVRSPGMVIDVAILGEVERGRLVCRSGAKIGDQLLVTGRLGGAVRSGRHLTFMPRLKEARALGDRVRPHAMIDLSDGLVQGLSDLCQASRVGALLEASQIPRFKGASLGQALSEGEDFELLIAVGPAQTDRLLSWARQHLACGLRRIGRMVPWRKDHRIELLVPPGMPVPDRLQGFQHF